MEAAREENRDKKRLIDIFGSIPLVVKALGVGVAAALGFWWWWLTPVPQEVRAANVKAKSFSVGWVSETPAKGCVLVYKKAWRTAFRFGCFKTKKKAHLVDVKKLEAKSSYGMVMVEGLRLTFRQMPEVVTRGIADELPPRPEPGYGSVIDETNQQLPGVLVYVYAMSGQPQAPAAVLTNEQGNYAVDLGNVELAISNYLLEASRAPGEKVRIEGDVRFSTPFAPIAFRTRSQ